MFAPLLEVSMWKKCTPLWRETHVQMKIYKTPHFRTTFASSDVVSPKAAPLPEAAFQTYSPKYLCEIIVPKRLYFKAIPQSGSPKPFSKAAPESCSAKLLAKAAPQTCVLKLVPKAAVFKTFVCSCRAKLLLQATPASQSCSPKLFNKDIPQSCSPIFFFREQLRIAAPQSR